MKAILEFDLNDFHDKLAHKRCINATNAYLCLFDIREKLLETEYKAIMFNEILNKYGVDLYDLE